MNRVTKILLCVGLAFCLLPSEDLMARGFGGGGRGGGASKSRGGASASRGGASASRGGATASRGGASKSRGGASATRQSASASRGGASANRSQASASTPGRTAAGQTGSKSATGSRGGSVTVGGAKGGVKGPAGGSAGKAGGVQVEGPRGNTATKGGAAGASKGPDGATAGRVGGAQVDGPGDRTASRGAAAGVAAGPEGAVAGQARGASASGPRGSVSGGEARAAGRSLSTDAGLSKYRGGVSVRGAGGTATHRTRSVTAATRHTHGTSVRRNVGVRYADRGNWFASDWYDRYPSAWRAAGLSTAAVWTAASWNSLASWWGTPATAQPVYYDYGNTIVYEGDTVYNGTEQIATAGEYYDQAAQIATAGQSETDDSEEWMSLGVWAMVKGDETESNNILQLAVNKTGVIRGNHYNALNDVTQPIQGSVDGTTQRAAWTIGDNTQVVSETGISNLTEEETEMLIHYGSDRTEQWTLVRLEEPEQDNTLGG